MLLTGTMTPECCTHWDWGCVVSLTGGKGENILTSLDAGGGGRGAIREARSRGASAGSDMPVVVCVEVRPGWRVGSADKPGGGGMIVGVGERKVRRGLEGMGVPSSSSGVGGRGAIREESS